MPPVHETHAVDRVQHHLDTLLPSQLFTSEYGRILELQAYPVMPHVGAHIYVKLKEAEKDSKFTIDSRKSKKNGCCEIHLEIFFPEMFLGSLKDNQ